MAGSTTAVPYTEAELPILDLTVPEFWQDINPPLAAAMAQAPLALTTDGGVYVLRHDDVEGVLKDGRFIAADLLGMMGMTSGPVWEWWQMVMFSRNPPDHTRLRRLVSRAFTPKSVDKMRVWSREMVEEVLAPALATGELDAMGAFGHEIPSRVMAHMLGIPESDREAFAGWTTDIGLAFNAALDPVVREQVEAALASLDAYVRSLIDGRRKTAGDDLLSGLLAVEEDGDRLSTEELIAMVENLLFAGHDTTRSAIAIMVLLFAKYPDQYERVRSNRALLNSAVEEVLRFEAVSFTTSRLAAEDCEVGGMIIPEGTSVALCLPAASRDPRRYDHPDRFDVSRVDVTPPVFGAGIHFCLGAPLARMEMQETLSVLLDHCQGFELLAEPQWTPFAHVRRLESVPVRLVLD